MKRPTLKRRFIPIVTATLFVAVMTGCFTGIESTPKITANDVKKENITTKPEDVFLADIKPQPFGEWAEGKRFYVSDNRFDLLLSNHGYTSGNLAGQEIVYKDCNKVTDISGNEVAELTFASPAGEPLVYRTSSSPAAIARAGALNVPFLVEMSVVDDVAKRLEGNTYYMTTSAWYDVEMKAIKGRKFVPVKVQRVRPGNSYYSVILDLTDEVGKPFCLYLSVGNDLKSLRQFGSLFALTDPRVNYPSVSDETWRNIIDGKVATDMTRDECRLALGQPATVDRQVGYSTLREIWTYENGVYLIFDDGILKTFRQ